MSEADEQHRTLSRRLLGVFVAAAGAGMCMHLMGWFPLAWVAGVNVLLTQAGLAGLIVLAAGGYAWPIVARVAPGGAPPGLRVVTACALGLWVLSTGVLILGTCGVLTGWVWWPVVGVGAVAAGWQGRHALRRWKPPQRHDGRALVWVLVAAGAGVWLAGALRPAGHIGASDAYDVLEYHLQLPREYLFAGSVRQTPRNAYGYYPLGVEMLFTLGMVLCGGAYEGMYLAKTLHGIFGVLTVAGVWCALRPEDDTRARFAVALLGTTPALLYLSWLAMVDLAAVCYLAVALLWLRHWLQADAPADDRRPPDRAVRRRAAACVGLMLGAACCTKYLAVGFVVAPVAAVMLLAAVRRPRRLASTTLAGVLTVAVFSPWLVRNFAYTRNPVFPLMTRTFGGAHWSEQSERRWIDGHGPARKPPVPEPAGWEPPPGGYPGRVEMFWGHFLSSQMFGTIVLIVAGVAVAVMIADRKPPDGWDASLVGVGVVQLGVWTAFTHAMPWRFVTPVMVPICLLAAGALARLARTQVNPLRRGATRPPGAPWGLAPAGVILLCAAGVNLISARGAFLYSASTRVDAPFPAAQIAERPPYRFAAELPEGSRILLVGQAAAFYFPPDTVYATPFDDHPLAELVREARKENKPPAWIARKLRDDGITHIWVSWAEIARLARTYGYPAALGGRSILRQQQAGPDRRIDVIEAMIARGLARHVMDLHLTRDETGMLRVTSRPATPAPATRPATRPATAPATRPTDRPTTPPTRPPWITVYEMLNTD